MVVVLEGGAWVSVLSGRSGNEVSPFRRDCAGPEQEAEVGGGVVRGHGDTLVVGTLEGHFGARARRASGAGGQGGAGGVMGPGVWIGKVRGL